MAVETAVNDAAPQRRLGKRVRGGAERRRLAQGMIESLDQALALLADDEIEPCAEPEVVAPTPAQDELVLDWQGKLVPERRLRYLTEAETERLVEYGLAQPGQRLLTADTAAEGAELTAGGKPSVESPPVSYRLVENGLEFEPGTGYVAWERDVLGLIAVKRKIDWALADALAFGEERFGEAASQVLDDTPFATQTLWNLASLARRVPRELRNDDLAFSVQAEVAPLRYADQKVILTQAAEEGLKREEVRDRVRSLKRERAREEAEQRPVPTLPAGALQTVEQADARSLPLESGTIDLILTSPPYGIMDGDTGVRKYRLDDDYSRWVELMADFLDEAVRVLAPQGRLVVNLPIDTWVGGENGGMRPVAGVFQQLALSRALTYVTTIMWDEGNISKSVARGSVDSPGAPRVISRQETIGVYCKGQYQRPAGELTTDLTHEEWLELTDGTWKVPGESNPWEGFEAAWPRRIPDQILKLFSFREDTVCDPFVGSGTTAISAWRLGRRGWFYDLDQMQVASTQRRLATAARGAL